MRHLVFQRQDATLSVDEQIVKIEQTAVFSTQETRNKSNDEAAHVWKQHQCHGYVTMELNASIAQCDVSLARAMICGVVSR